MKQQLEILLCCRTWPWYAHSISLQNCWILIFKHIILQTVLSTPYYRNRWSKVPTSWSTCSTHNVVSKQASVKPQRPTKSLIKSSEISTVTPGSNLNLASQILGFSTHLNTDVLKNFLPSLQKYQAKRSLTLEKTCRKGTKRQLTLKNCTSIFYPPTADFVISLITGIFSRFLVH